jgi:hypothetical protein
MVLFVSNYDVDVAGASKAVVCNREQTIRVRWKIYTHHVWAFVDNDVKKSRILVRKAIVILPGYQLAICFQFQAAMNHELTHLQTVAVMSIFNDATLTRHSTSRHFSSHLQC